MSYRIPDALIGEANAKVAAAHDEDYGALGRRLKRSSVDIDAVTAKVAAFAVAVPTWGVGTGGTRFARFPGPGEPRGIFDKLEDCATIQQLTRATPTCSPHFPWDKVSDYRELAERAKALGVGFDAVNRMSPAKTSPTSSVRSATARRRSGTRRSRTTSSASRSAKSSAPRR
jgi:L-rhamnose isomerase/sugar isomerase